jgi:hypothetical protein
VDLTLYAGDDVEFRLICKDPDGDPIDISGSMAAQIRLDRKAASAVLVEFTTQMLDTANGIALLSLTGDQTTSLITDWDAGKFSGVWDVQWTTASGETRTLCQGKVECLADVTRPA